MCKNNFTNENEFDYWLPDFFPRMKPDSVCNPSGPLGCVIYTYGPTIIIKN